MDNHNSSYMRVIVTDLWVLTDPSGRWIITKTSHVDHFCDWGLSELSGIDKKIVHMLGGGDPGEGLGAVEAASAESGAKMGVGDHLL